MAPEMADRFPETYECREDCITYETLWSPFHTWKTLPTVSSLSSIQGGDDDADMEQSKHKKEWLGVLFLSSKSEPLLLYQIKLKSFLYRKLNLCLGRMIAT